MQPHGDAYIMQPSEAFSHSFCVVSSITDSRFSLSACNVCAMCTPTAAVCSVTLNPCQPSRDSADQDLACVSHRRRRNDAPIRPSLSVLPPVQQKRPSRPRSNAAVLIAYWIDGLSLSLSLVRLPSRPAAHNVPVLQPVTVLINTDGPPA